MAHDISRYITVWHIFMSWAAEAGFVANKTREIYVNATHFYRNFTTAWSIKIGSEAAAAAAAAKAITGQQLIDRRLKGTNRNKNEKTNIN